MIINENTNKMTGKRSVFFQLDVSFFERRNSTLVKENQVTGPAQIQRV